MPKNLLAGAVAVASALVLSSCSSSDQPSMPGMSSSSPAPSPGQEAAGHNADDVAFAQQMVPHHSQALDMAKLVPSRST
ncbi:DUF305 domain-containing protein, partial [Amycolatopsis vancoresmycina]